MRGKLSRMWRSSISLMLVFCMLISMAPAAFATDSSSEQTTIKYVSLGDSVSLGNGSYPNLFESWLVEEGYADKVEHSALAMDAMRAEDLHFILTYSGANSAVAEGEWNEAAWNNAFSAGDYYTWKNFTSNGIITAEVAEKYQAAVAAADLLTVGIGNANFGDFLMDCAMDAVNGELVEADVELAMGNLNESLKTELMAVYNKLLAKLEAEVGNEMAVSLANAMVYTMVGCVVNYEAALDEIVAMNSDVEIIIVPVINTMDGVKLTYNGNTYDIGSYIDNGLKVLNAYLALVATKYENTIFYAEVGEVELQGNAAGALTRAEIMDTVIGDGDGMIWELLADQVGDVYDGAELVAIDKAFVDEYEGWSAEARAKYVAKLDDNNELIMDNVNMAISAALYLAFEEAIIESQGAALSVEGLKDLSNMSALLDTVMDTFNAELDAVRADYKDEAENAAYEVVADKVNEKIYNTMIEEGVDEANAASVTLTVDEVKTLLAGGTEADAIINDLSYEIAVAGVKSKLNISTDEANSIGLNVDGIKAILAGEGDALLTDLAYRGMAKRIADGEESLMTGYEEYKDYLDTYAEVKELYENDDKVYELIAGEVNKKLCEGDELTAENIKNLVNDINAPAENALLKSFADRKIAEAIETIYAEEAGNANSSLETNILTADDIVDLYFGNEDTVKLMAYRVLLDKADEDEALVEYLLNGDVNNAAAYVLNKANGTELTDADIQAACDANDEATVALVGEMSTKSAELIAQKAEIEEKLTGIKNTVTDRVAAQNIEQEIADRKQQIVDAANKLEEIKVDGLEKAKNDENDGIIATINTKLDEAVTKLNSELGETDYAGIVNDSIDSLCDLLAVSEALVVAVEENATLTGILSIMARCVIGDGLGFLPTTDGHKTIAEAVEKAYKDKHTVQDETKENVDLALDKVIDVLEENGMLIIDEAMIKAGAEKAYEYITNLDAAATALKAALEGKITEYQTNLIPAIIDDLEDLEVVLGALEAKLAALEAKLDSLEKQLDEIEQMPDAAVSTVEALEKAISETKDAIAETKEKIATINDAIDSLEAQLEQLLVTLNELKSAVEQMDTAILSLYNAVKTKDISVKEAIANLKAARDGAITAVNTVEKLYNQLKELAKDIIKGIDLVKEEAVAVVAVVGGALYVAYKLLPESVEAKVKADAEAKIADLEEQIAAKKAEMAAAADAALKAQIQKQIDTLEAEILEIKTQTEKDIADLGANPDVIEILEYTLKDTSAAIYGEYEDVTGAFKIDVDTKNAVIDESVQSINDLLAFAEDEIDKIIADAKAIYVDVTTDTYTIYKDSLYVALGDESAKSTSYVDMLAADAQLKMEDAYENAYDNRTIDQMLSDIIGGDSSAVVEEADLITIRFDNSQIVKNAFIHAFTYMKGAEVYAFNWADLIGEKGVDDVEAFLADLEAKLVDRGMRDMQLIDGLPADGCTLDKALVHMAEAYLYYSVKYLYSIPDYLVEIRELNPDATVVFVGMSNPFGETVLTHENLNIEIGSYVDTIIDYVDMIGVAYCMLFPNATYVSAKDVETQVTDVELDLTKFFMSYIQDQYTTLYPTATGHEYIKNQILKALTIIDLRNCEHVAGEPVEENRVEATCSVAGSYDQVIYCTICGEEMNRETVTIPATGVHVDEDGDNYCDECGKVMGLWGDADSDGVVTTNDAMMVLQYAVGVREAGTLDLTVSDVDGDGDFTTNDAMMILQYAVGVRDIFPVEM